MKENKLDNFKCPSCGNQMDSGYIVGHWIRLMWSATDKIYTIFGGKPLTKKIKWFKAPMIKATRCDKCKVGMFEYDN